MSDCIFCKIINKEIPSQVVDENEDVIVFISLQGHPMVVTKKHIATIYDLDDQSAAAVMQEAVKVARAVKKNLGADGVNLVQNNEQAAGQEVEHFHLHIKPRFHNDGVRIVFPEDNKMSIFEKLKTAL